MTKRSFTIKGVRAKKCLDLVHTHVYEPFNVYTHGRYEYFITLIDDYSRYGYVTLCIRI